MDTVVELSASHPFVSVEPSTRNLALDALAVGSSQPVTGSFTMICSDAGTDILQVTAAIAPASPSDVDPNETNDTATAQRSFECLLPVAINIQPGRFPNRVNAGSGLVGVSVLTTDTGEYGLPSLFDASWIDPASIRFGLRDRVLAGDGAMVHGRVAYADMMERTDERTRDGDDDLWVFFRADASGLSVGDVEACLVGTFNRPDGSGGRFVACDSVVVLFLQRIS